jgi:tRNA/tmRNA/rRNA uracil-C5-methylase (TrmA/RlmC/RlmD family)
MKPGLSSPSTKARPPSVLRAASVAQVTGLSPATLNGGGVNPNKALWEKGDFTRIAESMRESGATLVEGLGVTKGLKVLDLGCGDGTTAIPAAKAGADVLGVDIAANLVAAGNRRAHAEGLANCRFQEGDASNLSTWRTGRSTWS